MPTRQQSFLGPLLLITIFLIALPYTQPNIGGYGLQLPFNNTVWLTTLLFISCGLFAGVQQGHWLFPNNAVHYVLLLAALFSPLIWPSSQFDPVFARILCLVAGLFFMLALSQYFPTPETHRILLFIILLSVLLQAIIGTLQIMSLDWFISTKSARPTGGFQQPNLFASYLATGIIIALWLLIRFPLPRPGTPRIGWLSVIYLTLFLSCLCLFLALSRTGIIGVCGALFLLLLQPKPINKRWLMIGLIVMVLADLTAGIYVELSETETRSSATIANNTPREGLWQVSWRLFTDHPLTGVGLGNFATSYAEARAQLFLDTGLLAVKNPDHPHNELLFWAVEGGLIPLLGMVVFSLLFLKRLWSTSKENFFGFCALLFPMLLHCMTEFPFYYSAAHWLVFVALFFCAEATGQPLKSYPIKFPFLVKSLAASSLIAGTAFFITNLHTLSKIVETGQRLADQNQSKPLEPLTQVHNAVVFNQQIIHISQIARYRWAITTRSEAELRQFLAWGWQFSTKIVREETFERMLVAAKVLNDEQEIEKVSRRAHWLFPKNSLFIDQSAASDSQ